MRLGNAAQAFSRHLLPQADKGSHLGVKALLLAAPPTLGASATHRWTHFCILLVKQLLAPWEVHRFKASEENLVHPLLKCGLV